MKRLWNVPIASVMLSAGGCVATTDLLGSPKTCTDTVEANRRLVTDFYRMAIVERDPKAAFVRYAAPDFIEHKPDVPGGTRESTAEFLAELVQSMPEAKWTVERTVAEADMVVLHVRFSPAPGAPEYAIADFFRVRECRIVEHWDVVAPPSRNAVNPNGAF